MKSKYKIVLLLLIFSVTIVAPIVCTVSYHLKQQKKTTQNTILLQQQNFEKHER